MFSYLYVASSFLIASSPQAISSGMLRKPPTNLNRQSEEATILLIKEVIAKGIELSEVWSSHTYAYFGLLSEPIGIRRCPGQHNDLREIPLQCLPRNSFHGDKQSRLEVQNRRCS